MDIRTYGAYGYRVATNVDVARTGYAGEVVQETLGWYILGRRFFIPWLRRFISPDSLSPFGAGGLHRYGYCACDPINHIDPSGRASFGWLSKLLGQLTGMAKTAAHAMAAITPTTAFTALSSAVQVVSVSVGIGAAAASALGDAQAAGILGWIAAGGVAATGLGVAAQALGQGTRTPLDKNGARHVGAGLTADRSSRPNRTARAKDLLFGGPGTHDEIISSRRDSLGQEVHEMRTMHYAEAEWHIYRHPDNPDSVHLVNDSVVPSNELRAPLIAMVKAGIRVENVTIYGNVHGYRHGMNRDPNGRWAYPAPDMFEGLENNSGSAFWRSNVDPFDVSIHSAEAYRGNMRRSGAHIHYYCYSGHSLDVVEELQIAGLRMAPEPVYSTGWYQRPNL